MKQNHYHLTFAIIIFSFLILSIVPFDDAYANFNNKPTNQYNSPQIIFENREYTQDETITATCTPDDQKPTTNIIWRVIHQSPPREQFVFTHESENFSFFAGDYPVGEYTINCRTNFGDGHTISDRLKFKIIPGVIQSGLQSTNGIDPTISITSTETKKKNNHNGCNDCTPPTIGLDKNGKRFVDYGLTLNNIPFQANYFKTDMPSQYTELNKENHLSIKVYENNGAYNIDYIQFGLVKEIGSPINNYQPRLEIDIQNTSNDIENPSLEHVKLFDENNIISEYGVDVSLVNCMEGFNHTCLQLDIYWTFIKVPIHNVLSITGWDNNNNSFTTFFNHGLITIDPNYVEPILKESPKDKECKIYKSPKRIHSCQFQPMIDYEIKRAEQIMKEIMK